MPVANGASAAASLVPTEEGPLPTIDLTAKVWFEHVHKASGKSFLADVGAATRRCDPLSSCCNITDDLQRVRRWWFAETKDCTLQTSETALPTVLRLMHESTPAAKLVSSGRGTVEPALLSMYRHPIERCRSHWSFQNQVAGCAESPKRPSCRRIQALFPDTPAGHRRFVEQKCSDHTSAKYELEFGLTRPGGVFEWIQRNVPFWGITESYRASMCLLWFQASQPVRFAGCSCADAANSTTHLGPHGESGVSPLSLSDAELEKANVRDLALYALLRSSFERRVRLVEQHTRTSFLCSEHPLGSASSLSSLSK